MNRYDKEERIIQTFQNLKRWMIKIFPLNFNNILLYRLIHNKLLWKTWIDASSKNALPPDFYNNKFKLMMDVMRIDDHTFVDKNGKVINRHNERESQITKQLIDKNKAIKEIAEAGNLFINPYCGLEGHEDHNYKLYVDNFKRVIEKHIQKIEKYKNNHPGFKTIFFVFDESTPYIKLIDCEVPKGPGELIIGDLHCWWKDSNMLNILKDSNIDYLIWITPFKIFKSIQKVRYPLAAIYDVSKIKFNKNIKYELDELESLER